MRWRVTGASARGSSHLRSGLPNQDACEFRGGDRSSALRAVLAVSDGHGGARHFRSQVGSALAVHTAVTVLFEALETLLAETGAGIRGGPVDSAIPGLIENICGAWRAAVLSDFQLNPFTREELERVEAADGAIARASVETDPVFAYGATLLATAVTDEFVLYLQIGDGDVLCVDENGGTARPVPADARLVANQTTSLCLPDAPLQFRYAIHRQFPALVLAATDGYANSFKSDADFLKIGADYLAILKKQGIDALAEELPAILSGASQEGSGDDITLGILQRTSGSGTTSSFAVPAAAVAAVSAPAPEPPSRNRAGFLWLGGAGAMLAAMVAGWFWFATCCAPAPVVATKTPVPPLAAHAPVAAAPPKKPAAAPAASPDTLPKGTAFALDLSESGGPVIELEPGDTILFNALHPEAEPSGEVYAEVRRGEKNVWELVNRGPDTWTIQKSGRKSVEPPVTNGGSVPLAAKHRITFRNGTSATVKIVKTTRKAAAGKDQ